MSPPLLVAPSGVGCQPFSGHRVLAHARQLSDGDLPAEVVTMDVTSSGCGCKLAIDHVNIRKSLPMVIALRLNNGDFELRLISYGNKT